MNNRQTLELTWIGKENRPRLEPRILLEDPERSYHAKHRVTDHDLFDNRLIFGDNLLALKALEQEFTGKIKCIYIDPPYNTGSAFEHYDDGVEHSLWLSLMRDRLGDSVASARARRIAVDHHRRQRDAHYLKVLWMRLCGRRQFCCATWSGRNGTHARIVKQLAISSRIRPRLCERARWVQRDTQQASVTEEQAEPVTRIRTMIRVDPGGRFLLPRAGLCAPNQMYEIVTPSRQGA